MIAVVQRCSRGEVRVGGDRVGALGERGGLVVLLGVETGDTIEHARKMGDKLIKLRIFEDGEGKMNLAGDCSGGNRPSFVRAARPEAAEPLVNEVVARIAESGLAVETGRFRTEMKVDILNDGPVTLIVRVG